MIRLAALSMLVLLSLDVTPLRPVQSHSAAMALDSVVPNDNRVAGGTTRAGIVELHLEARLAPWRPDLDVDTMVTVQVFSEIGGAPRIPGPLLRVASGTEVLVTIRNSIPDSTLVVYGLRAGTVANDTIQVAPGATRELRFRAGLPGTYLYWGTTTGSPLNNRTLRDSQLTGAIVVDGAGVKRDSAERIFVITVIDIFAGDTVRNRKNEEIWEPVINGRAWPHSERLTYGVGDTVRWRWLNGGYLPHPMHLHGFHFRVRAKGTGVSDTTYAANRTRLAVTELMMPGTTFQMEWTPSRAGNWLMHCHMIPHITPFPERADSVRTHDVHDVEKHPVSAMAGIVLGITTVDSRTTRAVVPTVTKRLRMFAQETRADSGKAPRRGYVVQHGAVPRADSVNVTSEPLIVRQGETTAITVINRLREATTVHWHGMELESVFDGVSGWSRSGGSIAPLVAPGDSFTVTITPPRAGTYIYHTHMDEGQQLVTGLYGPLIVLARSERYDANTDITMVVGQAVNEGKVVFALNGQGKPYDRALRVGTRYRLRFVNIMFAPVAGLRLAADSATLSWRPLSKDGAALPTDRRAIEPAVLRRMGVGETYDFEWTPTRAMDAVLNVEVFEPGGSKFLRQVFRVR